MGQLQPYTAAEIRVMRNTFATWCARRNIASDSAIGQDVALHILQLMALRRRTKEQLLQQLETLGRPN